MIDAVPRGDLPALVNETMTPFVIFALHRTGSTFLVNALNGHPDIVCGYELFLPGAGVDGIDLNDPIGSMDRWFAARKHVPFAGFKLMLNQSAEVMHEVARRQYRVIFLTRPNELARQSSQLIARKTGKRERRAGLAQVVTHLFKAVNGSYNSQLAKRLIQAEGLSSAKAEMITFDSKRFERMRRRTAKLIRQTEAVLAEYNLEPLRVEYPAITTQENMRKALRFIGAEEVDLASALQKMNPPDILERYSNPDEVLRYLDENGLSDWAREGVTA